MKSSRGTGEFCGALKLALLTSVSLTLTARADMISNFTEIPDAVSAAIQSTSQSQSQLYMYQNQKGMRSGVSVFDSYYQKQLENVRTQANADIDLVMLTTHELVSEIQSNKDDFQACFDKNGSLEHDWNAFQKALANVRSFRGPLNAARDHNFAGAQQQIVSSSLRNQFSTIAEDLDPSSNENIFERIRRKCCPMLGDAAKDKNVCNESFIQDKLAKLDDMKPVNTKYVDPLNPRSTAQFNLTPQDMMALASVNKLGNFTNATDFNTQLAALSAASSTCQDAQRNVVDSLMHKGQMIGVFQNTANMIHCSMWSLASNWNPTLRSAVLGMTEGTMTMPTMVSQCSPQVIAQAKSMLSYTLPQFSQEMGRYFTLPPAIQYSLPVSNPVVVHNFGSSGLSVSLMDQSGNSVSNLFMPGLSTYTNLQTTQTGLTVSGLSSGLTTTSTTSGRQTTIAAASKVAGGRTIASVANNVNFANAPTTMHVTASTFSEAPRGGSVVDNVSGDSATARVAVRSMASKILNGDTESARILSNSIAAKVSDLNNRITNMSADSAAKSRGLQRAAAARSLVEQFTATDAALNTASNMSLMNNSLARAVGMKYVASTSTGSRTYVSASTVLPQSTVVSNLTGSQTISQAQAAITAQQTAITNAMNQISLSATALSPIVAKINALIAKKNLAIENFYLDMNPATAYQTLYNDGADKRISDEAKIESQYAKDVQKIQLIDIEIVGLQAMETMAQSSIVNQVRAAAAFDGLKVQYTNGLTGATTSLASTVSNLSGTTIPYGLSTTGTGTLTTAVNPYGFNTTNTLSGYNTGLTGYNNTLSGYSSGLAGYSNGLTTPTILRSLPQGSPAALPAGVAQPPTFSLPSQGTGDIGPLWKIFDSLLPSAYATVDRRQTVMDAWGKYMEEYDAYVNRLRNDRFDVQNKMWAQYLKHERESREEESILPVGYRNELIAFSETLKEEIPDMRDARQHKNLDSAANPQIYNYIADIEKSSNELRDLLAKEALYSWQAKSKDPLEAGDSWAGMLPAMALQP